MRLLPPDVAELPVPAALYDTDGAVLASTPAWRGLGPGATTYRVGAVRLVVGNEDTDPDISVITARLVAELRAATTSATNREQALRLAMLTAGIGLVAGCVDLQGGTTTDVLDMLHAAVATVSATPITVVDHHPGFVVDAAVLALALKQIVVNARRHDDATAVRLRIDRGPTFVLEWRGVPPPDGVLTARHQAERQRWGWGYVRLAADALGAVALAPASLRSRAVQATLAVDATPRLRLPVAAIGEDHLIERASPAWDEDTRLPPPSAIPPDLADLVREAATHPGRIVVQAQRHARRGRRRTWVAIPPQNSRDRARDSIRGLLHEQDLWDADVPHRTRVQALVHLIAVLLGDPMPRYAPEAFPEVFAAACSALGVSPTPSISLAAAAPDPALTAYLVSSLDATPVAHDGAVALLVPRHRREDPVARHLADATGVINLLPPNAAKPDALTDWGRTQHAP